MVRWPRRYEKLDGFLDYREYHIISFVSDTRKSKISKIIIDLKNQIPKSLSFQIDPKFESNEYFVADVQSGTMDVDGFASKSLNANVNLFNFDMNMKERYDKGS